MIKEIRERRSIRRFLDKEIPLEKLERLVSAGSYAPSPFNTQPWLFVYVTDKEKKKRIREIYDNATRKIKFLKRLHLTSVPIYDQDTSFLETGSLIVPCYKKNLSNARDSLSMACQNIMLEATSENIGSICLGRPTSFFTDEHKIKKLLEIPRIYQIPYLIIVGYSDLTLSTPKRKPIEQILYFNKFENIEDLDIIK